jgi:hypothetical protein
MAPSAKDGPLETARIAYIGLGATPRSSEHDPTRQQIEALKSEFRSALAHYLDPTVWLRRRVARSRTPAGAEITTSSPATVSGTKPQTSSASLSGITGDDVMTESMNDATRARSSAAAPDVSTWLSANAGSGKTRVLTDRVARLLLDEVRPNASSA